MLLINYESLFERSSKDKKKSNDLKQNIKDFIKSCKNHNVAIIIDESHKLKDIQSIQTKSIAKIINLLKLKANNLYTYLLTGTPFTTGYIDLYSQLKFLGYEYTKGDFIDNFCIRGYLPGLLGWQQPIVGYKNIECLFDLVHKYAITIKTEEVNNSLPEKVFISHKTRMSEHFKMFIQEKVNGLKLLEYCKLRKIKLPKELKDRYNVDKQVNNPFYSNINFPDEKWLAETSGNFWLRARQLSIGFQGNRDECVWFDKTRLKDLERLLEQNEDNYLLFYNYTPELLEIYSICEKLGYNIDVYSGEIKSLVFYDKWCKLSPEEKLTAKRKNIILANFSSGSTGMNWQQYSKCIIFSTPLYLEYEQGVKRIHRTGQKETTIYHEFYQNNWLDLGMKKSLDEGITYSNDMFKSDLSRVQELLEKEE